MGNSVIIHLERVDMRVHGSDIMGLGKDNIISLLKPLKNLLDGVDVKFTPDSDSGAEELFRALFDPSKSIRLLKEQLAYIYLSFCADIDNIYQVAHTSEELMKIWRRVIILPSVTEDQIEKMLGRRIATFSRYYSGFFTEAELSPLSVLEMISEYDRYNYRTRYMYKYTLLPGLRKKLADLFLGQSSTEVRTLPRLPENENWHVDTFDNQIAANLIYLKGVWMSGSLMGANGVVTTAKIKLLKKSLSTGEFSDNMRPERIELLANTFGAWNDYLLYDRKNKKVFDAADVGRFARFVVNDYAKTLSGVIFGVFIPEYKGFTRTWTSTNNASIVTKVVNSLILPAKEHWMDMSNFKMRYLCAPHPNNAKVAYTLLFPQNSRMKSGLSFADLEAGEIKEILAPKYIDWLESITFPFIASWLRLLCSIGVLDSVAGESGKEFFGMRYVRLTSLGRYALGLSDSFELPAAETSSQVEFDNDNCILTITGKNWPYEMFIRDISIPIGTTRFKITPQSLLKGCESSANLKERINSLEKIFDLKEMESLREVIKDAEFRTQCRLKTSKYSVVRFRTGIPGLAKIITEDPTIRPHILLAERNTVLVESAYMDKFRSILSSFGYLLD